jgi:hypothetical protein
VRILPIVKQGAAVDAQMPGESCDRVRLLFGELLASLNDRVAGSCMAGHDLLGLRVRIALIEIVGNGYGELIGVLKCERAAGAVFSIGYCWRLFRWVSRCRIFRLCGG